jgi:hypothetical protein
MDPITTAIVATLPALAASTVTTAVKDAYSALKSVIQQKWGAGNKVSQSVDALEANPKSTAQAASLAETVAETKATEDVDVMQALSKLVDVLKRENLGGNAIAKMNITITGGVVQGVVGAESVNVGSLSIGLPPAGSKS